MKAAYTSIVETKSQPNCVQVVVQPKGTDEGYDCITIHLSIHDKSVFIHFSGLDGKMIRLKTLAKNQLEINYVEDK